MRTKFSKIIALAILTLVCFAPLGPIGCAKTTLEEGSQYSQTGAKPDKAFYAADAAFELAVSAFTTITDFEKNNRQMLWDISPDIKHTLDKLRPQAKEITLAYAKARKAYNANPTPAGLSALETVLGRMQQLSSAAHAALPKK